jgi:ATP-dependent Clp protease ATP-binding subunit ClpA
MFERFTERARQVVVLAQDEAKRCRHNYIGSEHLLLGLLREEEGLASRVLESLGVELEEVRSKVNQYVGKGDEITTGQIPMTPRAKRILELSLREALSLGHNYIGTEHLLLGLVRENEGVAARVLLDFDADAQKIRGEILRLLSGPGRKTTSLKPAAHPRIVTEITRELQAMFDELISAVQGVLPYLVLSTESLESTEGALQNYTPAGRLRKEAEIMEARDSAIKALRESVK